MGDFNLFLAICEHPEIRLIRCLGYKNPLKAALGSCHYPLS